MVDRKEFLKTMAGITAGLMLPDFSLEAGRAGQDRLGKVLPRRKLGQTGLSVTMLGVGGYHIGGSMSEKEAQRTIETALEGGVRFFDTAESYQRGESERRYGKFLTPQYREDVFLMTKSTAGDAETAQRHLDESLKRLNTDHLDLWQVHSLQDPDDVDNRFANGVIDVFIKARESGKARHIGFTGHRNPLANARMLECTDIFATVQMPINVLDGSLETKAHSFIQHVIPTAVERNMGILAMKTLADGRFFNKKERVNWTSDDPVVPGRISLRDALYFAWTLPVSVLITGPDHARMMQEKIDLAMEFSELSEEKRNALFEKVADLAVAGKVEYYKEVS